MSKKKKKGQLKKTQVEQILDKNKIAYHQMEFPTHQDGDVRSMSVDHLGIDEHRIYKTLVLEGPTTGPLVGVVPVDSHLDEKALARVSGNKKVEMIPMKDLLPLTGYIRGGCSPVGMKKKFPTYIEEMAQLCEQVAVSAGQRGIQIILKPEDLCRYVEGTFASLV